MRTSEIAQRYTGYFEKHGHLVVPSASLISLIQTKLSIFEGWVLLVLFCRGEQNLQGKGITAI